MKRAVLFVLLFAGQALAADRFFGSLEISSYFAVASPFDGGVGGFETARAPIHADVVIMVDEGQSLTWEWIGIRPETTSQMTLPNVTLDTISSRAEFTDLTVDLNPTSTANKWAGPPVFLQYDRLDVEGSYSSFSHESEVSEVFRPGRSEPHGFKVSPTLDYGRFPDELTASVHSQYGYVFRTDGSFVGYGISFFSPARQVVLEPKLELSRLGIWGATNATSRLTFTPTGDANNDGSVGFDDFVILSGNFGMAEAARWDDGDFDGDGHVGFVDFVSLANNYGQTPVAAVPEPTELTLAFLAVVAVAARRVKP